MLRDWQHLDKDTLAPHDVQLAINAYDNCIASLDHDLGRLIDELHTRGLLAKTLLIITSDHGEQFGEHGTFGHGLSLYEPEVHVPLLMIAPGRIPPGRVAGQAASLPRPAGDGGRFPGIKRRLALPRHLNCRGLAGAAGPQRQSRLRPCPSWTRGSRTSRCHATHHRLTGRSGPSSPITMPTSIMGAAPRSDLRPRLRPDRVAQSQRRAASRAGPGTLPPYSRSTPGKGEAGTMTHNTRHEPGEDQSPISRRFALQSTLAAAGGA